MMLRDPRGAWVALLYDREGHAVLRAFPHQLDRPAAALRARNRHRELVHRRGELRLGQRRSEQILLLIVLKPPLADLVIDDQLRRAVLGRKHEEGVGAGGNRLVADLDRLLSYHQGGLVVPHPPNLSVRDEPTPNLPDRARLGVLRVRAAVVDGHPISIDDGARDVRRADPRRLSEDRRRRAYSDGKTEKRGEQVVGSEHAFSFCERGNRIPRRAAPKPPGEIDCCARYTYNPFDSDRRSLASRSFSEGRGLSEDKLGGSNHRLTRNSGTRHGCTQHRALPAVDDIEGWRGGVGGGILQRCAWAAV